MGTYETRGGTAASPDAPEPVIYAEEDLALSLLEQACVSSDVNDQIVTIIRGLCERRIKTCKPEAIWVEKVTWYPVTSLPDSDLTVQLFDEESDEPVWPGYFDGEQWLYADGSIAHPTSWAHFAKGPAQRAGLSDSASPGDA